MYSIVGKQYRGLQAWEYPCGPLWLIISGHIIQFQYSVAYSAPVECKTRGETDGGREGGRGDGGMEGGRKEQWRPHGDGEKSVYLNYDRPSN